MCYDFPLLDFSHERFVLSSNASYAPDGVLCNVISMINNANAMIENDVEVTESNRTLDPTRPDWLFGAQSIKLMKLWHLLTPMNPI